MAIRPEISEYISSHSEMVISEAKEILKTITNKEIELEFQGAEEFNFDDLSGIFTESVVGIDMNLESDPEGKIHIFIEKPAAARVGSLMMMMEEEEVEFSEDHIDAMKETTNQIIGGISTKMKSTEEKAPTPSNMNAQEVTLAADMFELPDLITAKFSLKIAEDEPTTLVSVFTSSVIASLMDGETATEAGEAEAATEVSEGEETPEGAETAEGEEGTEASEEGGESEDSGMGDLDISGMLDEEGEGEEIEIPEPDMAAADTPKPASEVESKFDFLMDLTFPVSIELGRTKMLIKDILELGHGSVIEFEKLAGEPVDLLVDDKKIAEGEVVVVDEHFGIRVTSLNRASDILKDLGSKS